MPVPVNSSTIRSKLWCSATRTVVSTRPCLPEPSANAGSPSRLLSWEASAEAASGEAASEVGCCELVISLLAEALVGSSPWSVPQATRRATTVALLNKAVVARCTSLHPKPHYRSDRSRRRSDSNSHIEQTVTDGKTPE